MAFSHSSTHSDAAKMEQVITEFFPKSLQIILESRSPYMSSRNYSGEQAASSPSSSSSSSSSVRPRDKWFNLALRECPATIENLDLWHQSYLEPMVVDVILVQRPLGWDSQCQNYSPKREFGRNFSSKERYPFYWNSDQEELNCEGKSEKIIERWAVQYESKRPRDCGSGSRRSSSTLHAFYKKLILLLRSLYVTVRLLPAYKIFRDLNSSGKIFTYTLTHRVSSFVEPFTHKEEADLQRFVFAPVDASCGRLCLSVHYRLSLSDINSGSSTPMSPQFIPDYVGSPLAEPLKRFPSLPVSHGSPSSFPFARRHSWSFDIYKASPPSFSFSPSPTHSEPQASISNPISRPFTPLNLPRHPPETSSDNKKNISFDEYSPSPNFTPSPSLSPPVYIPGSHRSKGISRCESAPVGIAAARFSGSHVMFNKQNLPPSPPLKGTRACNPKTDKSTAFIHTGATLEKVSFSIDSGRSFQDDFDEFPCHFDVEDDDMTDPAGRPESFDVKGLLRDPLDPGGLFPIRKSHDAAVGELVNMLNKAPPLHQDFSCSVNLSQDSHPKTWSSSNIQECNASLGGIAIQQAAASSFAASKTTADALEELRGYKEIVKDLLLRQAGMSTTSHTNSSAT